MKKKEKVYGRKEELSIFREILSSKEAEFLAVYGRRRVGKTFLIREFFSQKGIYLELTGQKDGKLTEQLENFSQVFSDSFLTNLSIRTPKSWKAAFDLLTQQIKKCPKNKKFILFLDELPWFAHPRSGFLQALDYYWNRHWSSHRNFILIACGSAASWMLDNLINAKGGLYNRLTKMVLLKPFNLKDASGYLKQRKIELSPKQLCDIYMVCGGIPYYLKQIARGKSATQNINRICFREDGLLFDEFDRLLNSLFDHSETHYNIIKSAADHPMGISRDGLIRKTGISSGGTLNKRIRELEAAGFLQSFVPFGFKKKQLSYRLIDEYTLFYLHWIDPLKKKGTEPPKTYWQTKAKTPSVLAWAGLAFEMICFKHVDAIIQALGLHGIHCEIGSWRSSPKKGSPDPGAQVDLFIDRDDGIISICEIKYSQNQFSIDKAYARQLMNKVEVFEKHFPSKKTTSITMITFNGIKSTLWSNELVNEEVVFEDLIK